MSEHERSDDEEQGDLDENVHDAGQDESDREDEEDEEDEEDDDDKNDDDLPKFLEMTEE